MSRRILVVDDDPGIRNVFTRYLRMQGYDVVVCGGVTDALECIDDATHLDGAILDISLPDGFPARIMAALYTKFPRVRVMYATGHQESPEFLFKPITLNVLGRKVREQIGPP